VQFLLATVLRWLLRHVFSLVLIVVVLLLGRAGWVEWRAWQAMQAESARLVHAERSLRESLQDLRIAANTRAAGLKTASLQALQARIAAVDSEIANQRLQSQALAGLGPVLAGQTLVEAQVQALQIDAVIGLLQQERTWLQSASLRLLATQSAQAQRAELERLRQVHLGLYAQWQAVRRERDALEQTHWVASRLPGTAAHQRRGALDARLAQLLADNQRAQDDHRRQLMGVNGARSLPPLAPLDLPASAVDDAIRPVSTRLDELRRIEASHVFGRWWGPVREVMPAALLILFGAMVVPVALKALFYFVLAPLAARRPPLRLLPHSGGVLELESGASAVSQAVTVDAEHELLVHAEFLQSASTDGDKSTQWLLNRRFALTSLSAGMVALTRIRSDEPASIVVSATQDPLAEIGVLKLPAGSAVVMQPHRLVGVMQRRDAPLRITAHWQLTSLHAWLTLQLRYLVLHGPVRLIVQGRRGVRVEAAGAARAINQAATMGFSANLPYSTRRCETFAAYLRGKQELLNDCFGSPNARDRDDPHSQGFFVYQEVPTAPGATRLIGRGLKGLTDSMLKVLGI
jgi:hypothetical protein